MIAGRTDMYGKVHDTICSSSNAPNYSSCYCDIIERTEQRALRQAREAVARLHTPGKGSLSGLCIKADALAAIDALKGGQA